MSAVFALDYNVGREFDLWLVYVAPVCLVSVLLGPRHGYLAALVATALLILTSLLLGNSYVSTAAFMVDRLSACVAYLLFAFLIGVARNSVAASDPSADSQPSIEQD